MLTIATSIRLKDWYDTKLPLNLTTVILFSTYVDSFIGFFVVYVFIFLSLSVGYICNNLADYKFDIIVGKVKSTSNLLSVQLCFLLIFSLILWTLIFFNFKLLLFTVLFLVLGLAYSIRPIRFKERGFLGVLMGGLSQRVMPSLPFLISNKPAFVCMLWIALCLVLGVRGMVLHQLKDYENDICSGTSTWITQIGKEQGEKFLSLLSIAPKIHI